MSWPEWTSPDGRIRLINADCLEVRDSLPEVDAVISDPPYGISHKSGGGTGGKWHNVKHQGETIYGDDAPFDPSPWLALGVPVILWGANFYSDRLPGGGWLVWDKRHGIEDMEFNRSDSELAFFSGSKTVKTFRHLWHGLCRATEIGKHLHPTQKPIELMAWCLSHLPDAETILDPFAGSCTTAIACIRTDRRCICIEKEPKYFQIGIDRCKREYARTVLFNEQEAYA